MRTRFFVLGVGLGLATAAHAQPIGWWKFDETSGGTAFASAGGIDGALNGDATFVTGVSGNAMRVTTAGSGYVNFGNNFALMGTSYTLSFWLNSTSTATDQIVVGKHRATSVSGYFVGMNQNGPYGATNRAWAYQGSTPGNQPISTTVVNDGAWHHVAVAYNVGTGAHSIYVDGGLAEDTRSAVGMSSASAPFMVGGIFTASGNPLATYNGMVDDLQIYGSRLSDQDINFLFSNPGQAVPEPMTLVGLGIAGLVLRRKLPRKATN